jgi:hypothetical protein
MSGNIQTHSELPHVDAALNYLAPMRERVRNYAYEPPPGVPRSNTAPEAHIVPIYDARPVASEITLDREGFALLESGTGVGDFWDDEEIRHIYYPEAEATIAAATGASRVFIFDHTRRKRVPGADDRTASTPRKPATRAHVDHTAKSGPQRVRDLLGHEAEHLLKGSVQVINLWRPIRGPLRDAPLAVCDTTTVAFTDFVPSDLVYRDRTGEIYRVRYNPAHRWFYIPEMQPNETIPIKCYDSAPDKARFTAHSAFEDPTASADVLPRESIELRTLVFHV